LPVVGIRMPEYFVNQAARNRVAAVLKSHQGKRMFTLTDHEKYDDARNKLAERGLAMGNSRPVSIYYFSSSLKFDLLLIEVVPRKSESADTKHRAEKGVPLPDSAFSAKLSVANAPSTMRAGQKYELRVLLKNESDITWPG